jgi:hypothetical protein
MSRKLLIGWCLMPFLNFLSFIIFAQEPSSVSDFFLLHCREQNFSVYVWLSSSNVSLASKNQFFLKELCTATISGSYIKKENAVALSVSHFGFSKYGMFTISSGYARSFSKRVSFGLHVHYILHHSGEYPKKHSFTFDLSLYGQISSKIGIGISAYNPANLKYGLTGQERIPMLYHIMLSYKINSKVLVAIAASKQFPGFFNITGTVCFRDKFYGFMMDVSFKQVGTQFSFWWKRIQFDFGGCFDYRLGFSPQVRINYWLK